MKKILILVLMAFVVNAVAFAQTYQEVVYLKNGSVIRGVIVEQIPSVSLKIQTADGSIFAYQMDEVEKITKEPAVNIYNTKGHSTYASNEYKLDSGYRGFVDVGYSVGIGDGGEFSLVEFTTVHGYQILPCLFAGFGVGVHYYHKLGELQIPVFADIQGMIPCRSNFQPFLDFRAGYSVYEDNGFYTSPSIGCRCAVSKICGISLSVGYTLHEMGARRHNKDALTFKVGVDF